MHANIFRLRSPSLPLPFRGALVPLCIYFIAEEKKERGLRRKPRRSPRIKMRRAAGLPRGTKTLTDRSQTELIRKVTKKIAPITQVATETCFILPVHTLTKM